MKVLLAGSGIGGLTTALTLHQASDSYGADRHYPASRSHPGTDVVPRVGRTCHWRRLERPAPGNDRERIAESASGPTACRWPLGVDPRRAGRAQPQRGCSPRSMPSTALANDLVREQRILHGAGRARGRAAGDALTERGESADPGEQVVFQFALRDVVLHQRARQLVLVPGKRFAQRVVGDPQPGALGVDLRAVG
jgi:hypothetical protein